MDAIKLGFHCNLILDASHPWDARKFDQLKIKMRDAGVDFLFSQELSKSAFGQKNKQSI
jgi:hypothetical protein